MRILTLIAGVFLFHCLCLSSLYSEPLPPSQVPDPLKPWIEWALRGEEGKTCPFLQGNAEERICQWPSLLDLRIDEKKGEFSQKWSVLQNGWIPLPGESKHWPQAVQANDQTVPVVPRDNQPSVYLKKGEYTLRGTYRWDSPPEAFQIPKQTGLLRLTVQGVKIPFPEREENGLVWIQKKDLQSKEENRLELRVHRKIDDGVPVLLTTSITLNLSGKSREIALGNPNLAGFTPLSLESALPAKIDPDGTLKIQARPGNWKIDLQSRSSAPVMSLSLPSKSKGQENWPSEEVFVFEANPSVRVVSLEGALPIDPTQTTLSDEWKRLPAYRLKAGDTIRFVEKRRGNAEPAPDTLSLSRQIWLDFSGEGYTLSDQISGVFNQSSRLEMNAPFVLGRASVNQQDQLITTLGQASSNRSGIEIRQRNFAGNAESRLEGPGRSIPLGWNHDFQNVRSILHLPPGWSLFHAWGADQISQTWMTRWNLLDLFLLLILSLAFARLWGKKWGIIALFALLLSFPENHSPRWIFVALLVFEAFSRLFPPGKAQALFRFFRACSVLLLIVLSIPFMAQQIRAGLYPALEQTETFEDTFDGLMLGGKAPTRSAAPLKLKNEISQEGVQDREEKPEEALKPAPSAGYRKKFGNMERGQEVEERKTPLPLGSLGKGGEQRLSAQTLLNLNEYRPDAKIQTGPGLPSWEWKRVSFGWNGMVKKGEALRVILISPLLNLILSLLRVTFLTLLILPTLQFLKESRAYRFCFASGLKSLLYLGPLSLFCFSSASFAQGAYPPKELLDELLHRLTEAPSCSPDCASIARMQLEVQGNRLRARLEVHALASTAIPLPGSAKEWEPDSIAIEGTSSTGLARSETGEFLLPLLPGVHSIVLEGPLPNRDNVQIALPLKPHHLEAKVEGWSVEGIHEDGGVEENLQLVRTSKDQNGENPDQKSALPPFVQVERILILGLNWEMETRIIRLSPLGAPVVLEIPLLEGESVTSPEVRAENRKVRVSLAAQANSFEWRSSLEERGDLSLKASAHPSWMEVWQLQASPVWHVEAKGIPALHPQQETNFIGQWRPWPGEELRLKISRPKAVAGPTLTSSQSHLVIHPGKRSSRFKLSFELKSSLGGEHTLILPEGAQLESVLVNQTFQPIRQNGRKVTLPIAPGKQSFELAWEQPDQGMTTWFRSPEVNLGVAGANQTIEVRLPQDRWTLWTQGPRLGPAVLFWSLLAVLIVLAALLGRIRLIPLKTHQWILLGIGLSQIPAFAAAAIPLWLLVLALRRQNAEVNRFWFNLRQFFIAGLTLVALGILFWAVEQGLLGQPDMQIAGNGSSGFFLQWFQDRGGARLAQVKIFSLPLLAYRLAMLVWALWLASALIGWLKWGWGCVSAGGLWKNLRRSRPQLEEKSPAITP